VSPLPDIAATDGKPCFIPMPEPGRVDFDADSDDALVYLTRRLGPTAA
jgi:hypothetical protein